MIKLLQPDYFIDHGDGNDFWQISKFSRDCRRKEDIYDDLVVRSKILDTWEKSLKSKTKVYIIEGNHEERLFKYICRKCPEIYKLVPSIPTILGFNARNRVGPAKWSWVPAFPWDGLKIHDVNFIHGFYYSQNTAQNNLSKYSCTQKIIQGHNHRIQEIIGQGGRWAISGGFGADIKQVDYLRAPNDWRRGMVVTTFIDGVGSAEILHVLDNNTIVFRGEVIKS